LNCVEKDDIILLILDMEIRTLNFNINELLSSFSCALDFVEQDLVQDVTNHGKRVAYVAARIGEKLSLSEEGLFDLISYSLLHDNGVTKSLHQLKDTKEFRKAELTRMHCIEGEKNIRVFPFFYPIPNVILYHHEHLDGSGLFGIQGSDIPLFSRIISLADTVAVLSSENKKGSEITRLIKHDKRLFDPAILEAFFQLSVNVEFWLNIDDYYVDSSLNKITPRVNKIFSYRDVRTVSQIFCNIIDAKSPFTGVHSRGISEKTGIMCEYYEYDEETYWKMRIAADLHDLGKIMISNEILDKNGPLNQHEINVIQSHVFYTRKALETITGFEEITEWAANHHEKLNGKGYPYGLDASRLDFNSRLLACIDIYQALTEDRPYRKALSHCQAIGILRNMARQNLIEASIVEDLSTTLNCECIPSLHNSAFHTVS
jgi:HD-GYP domain-containing protein (c-di-GMP phosphodiesterase class II)